MSATAFAGSRELGARIAEARRAAGMSQRTLAERLGISIWSLDEIEHGRREAAAHLPTIASLTDQPLDVVRVPRSIARPSPNETRLSYLEDEAALERARKLVLGSIAALVLIRFFTEVVPVLPRAANFIDIPIFFALVLAAKKRPVVRLQSGGGYIAFAPVILLFVLLCFVSAVVNVSRVEPGPFLVFVYGFLAPLGVYAAVYRLWPAGHAINVSRALVLLGAAQLVVVFGWDIPRFLVSEDPDQISGTFGTNAYQLVFFLLVVTGLLAGIFTFERRRLAAWATPMLFVLIFVVVFLAQYRALLVATALALVVIGVLLGRRGRGIVAGVAVVATFAITLSYVSSHFPSLKFDATITKLEETPAFYLSERLKAVHRVFRLYSDEPQSIVTGAGPGTFSSRAWGTFALAASRSRSNVQGRYVLALTGGRVYRTDVSDKYVLNDPNTRTFIEGSGSVTSPFASYPSLLAEVGVLGLALIVLIYLRATFAAIRMAARSVRLTVPGDPLPALLVASAVAFVLLLQMGILHGNWLETSRLTFLSWALLAIVTKEFEARYASNS